MAGRRKKQKEEEKLHEARLSNFRRDWQQIDTGASGKTIEMDERFVDNEQFKKMRKKQEDHNNLTAEEVLDITHGETAPNAFLAPGQPQIEDLVGIPSEQFMLPAKATPSKQSQSGMLPQANATAPGSGFPRLADEPEAQRKSPRPDPAGKDLGKVAKNNFFGDDKAQ